jgi:type IV pilus assembly protein PilB
MLLGRGAAHPPDLLEPLAVLRLGLASEHQVADAIATQLGLPRIDLEHDTVDPDAVERLPARISEQHDVLPIRVEGDVLVLATADPTDVVALDDARVAARARSIRPVVATRQALRVARRHAYRSDAKHDLLAGIDEPDEPDVEVEAPETPDQPVIRLVDAVVEEAVSSRASDIHVEPTADGLRVRVRIDGMLRETTRVPRSLAGQVLSRLKIMARLDIAERRLPQDGRTMATVDGQKVDLRVSTMPTMHGETIVLRLLPQGADRVAVDELGLDDHARGRLLDALARPQGLVLVTGPTGSGKTTTLYAGLAAVADPARNVLTLEDPVEVQLPGVNQTQIEPKIGLTFARGLRHVLRQDPDVVLVGEIRDRETAQLAVEASFTGHLVLATLHTNDAPSSVARLIDLGADRFLIASSLLLVLAQRLARRVCDRCTGPDQPDAEVVRRLGLDERALAGATLRRGGGCNACDGTGALGRVAVGETLPITPRLRELVIDGASETALTRQARLEGLRTLREEALSLALTGQITLDEALRVTPDPSTDVARCPGCSEPVADDHVVCPWCSTPLAAEHCGGCGRAVDTGWLTCPWCRRHLGDPAPDHEAGGSSGAPGT